MEEGEKPDTRFLRDIAIYLEGKKEGKGDLYPIGTHSLKVIWDAIKYINNQ